MQDLEHNMDDWFRKAADEYPLQMGDSRWNDIAAKLNYVKIEATAFHKKNNSRQGGKLLLLLLIFLGALGGLMKFTQTENRIHDTGKPREIAVENNPVKEVNNKEKDLVVAHKIKSEGSSRSSNVDRLKKKNQPKLGSISFREVVSPYPEWDAFENNKPTNKLGDGPEGSSESPTNYSDSQTNKGINNEVLGELEKDKKIGAVKNIDRNEVLTPHVNSTRQGIYFGLSFGPSFSKIKSGELHRIGYDISFLAGYKLNNKISIESGVLFAKKYYFSDGKYFNIDKVRSSMPSGMEVLDLEGNSSVFEIPLRIKYDLFRMHNAAFFSTAGISSGIMTNERNNYRTSMSGAEQNLAGSYNHVSAYFGNSLDISFGYENKIGKIGNVRIEPYVKIPLKGTGVGALPVVSTGLHMAFTRFSH